jgi:hypothetical protein
LHFRGQVATPRFDQEFLFPNGTVVVSSKTHPFAWVSVGTTSIGSVIPFDSSAGAFSVANNPAGRKVSLSVQALSVASNPHFTARTPSLIKEYPAEIFGCYLLW